MIRTYPTLNETARAMLYKSGVDPMRRLDSPGGPNEPVPPGGEGYTGVVGNPNLLHGQPGPSGGAFDLKSIVPVVVVVVLIYLFIR